MFNFSYSSPCEIQGEITLKKWPGSLGDYEDVVTGQTWNIHGIFGRRVEEKMEYWVQAVPVGALHSYYKRTDGLSDYNPNGTDLQSSGVVTQRWLPYKIVVQDERNVEAISPSPD